MIAHGIAVVCGYLFIMWVVWKTAACIEVAAQKNIHNKVRRSQEVSIRTHSQKSHMNHFNNICYATVYWRCFDENNKCVGQCNFVCEFFFFHWKLLLLKLPVDGEKRIRFALFKLNLIFIQTPHFVFETFLSCICMEALVLFYNKTIQ